MELRDFLVAHKNDWKDILSNAPYNLSIIEDGNLVKFVYTMDSEVNQITKEARGIIFERDTWKIVAFPFVRFFNAHEEWADTLDWNSTRALEKVDGTLIILYFYDGRWIVSTRKVIDAHARTDNAVGYTNFGELFDIAAQNSGLDYSKLDTTKTYVFELVSPLSQVVLFYDETRIYHIGTRSNVTLMESNDDIGVTKPREYHFNSYKEALAAAHDLIDEEGFVCVDKNWNRVKMKSEDWLTKHYLESHVVNFRLAVKIIKDGEASEFLSMRDCYKDFFAEVEAKMVANRARMEEIVAEVEKMKVEFPVKKWFALEVQKKDKVLRDLYFTAHKGMLLEWFDGLTADQYFKKFGEEVV